MSDYYETLGVARDADPEQIKKAYRKLAMEYHPDRNGGSPEAEARFKELSEAYEVLKDPQRRAAFDRFGKAGVGGAGGAGPFQGGFDLHDAIDIFMRDFGGGGGFEDLFGGQRRGGARRRSGGGETLRVRLPLTLRDVLHGAKKKIRLALFESCETCDGSGSADQSGAEVCSTCGGRGEERVAQRSVFGQFVSVTTCRSCGGEGRVVRNPCPTCHGEGRVRSESEVEVEVPPGVTSENFITLRGRGNAGPRGGARGDIAVLLEVEDDPRFLREGSHLLTEVVITTAQAALGAEVEIPTVDGSTTTRVPAGTQGGGAVRVKGRGLPDLNTGARGDLIVRVRVWTPTDLSSEQRDLYERLLEVEGPAPARVEEDEGRGLWSRIREAFTSG
ncbi:MAG: molecular chaperone DnaJ [Gemmatimonadota bacterium]